MSTVQLTDLLGNITQYEFQQRLVSFATTEDPSSSWNSLKMAVDNAEQQVDVPREKLETLAAVVLVMMLAERMIEAKTGEPSTF